MATARQILELLKSHVAGDDERFRTAALQVAANEARKGHDDLAKQIQELISKAPRIAQFPSQTKTNSINFARPQGELAGLLELIQPTVALQQLVLSPDLSRRLKRVVKEQQQFNKLREHGLRPRQRLLLLGPPGCGKTMTAHALAHELGLPLFVLRLDALFTKFLGETASKLRIVFDAIESHRAVFLFDEFDSLGLSRGAQSDVAEMRRVLNSFLVFLEGMRGHSLIIAASNHPESLDDALFRRFDDIIEYTLPSQDELKAVFEQRLANEMRSAINWKKILDASATLNLAEAVRAADDAVKERLIEQKPKLTTALLLKAIDERVKRTKRKPIESHGARRTKKAPPTR
ncbi:AAA family ATPase [Phragmitibacter flavus]|uniref:AAA family ATPase n=1 Tax=Phragmitibacter flavus TaxID=2576071 RepID=A0A5R8KGP8_9BACT|nr:ATP-binding protein [Phragmitibacter flavus]TLD71486.1 AAA family ATPase [Phragmitibacter flavus]